MTPERLQEIERAADAMLGQVEWCDFPLVPEPTATLLNAALAAAMESADFSALARRDLRTRFGVLRDIAGRLPDHQEVDLQAAGLVQSAVKAAFRGLDPAFGAAVADQPVRTKFRRLIHPVVQAPPNVRVPSMRAQLARRSMGMPPVDVVERPPS